MDEERLINLEIRYSHQQDFIEQLNAVVTEQQRIIERLEKDVLDLKRNINVSGNESERLSNEKPPHY